LQSSAGGPAWLRSSFGNRQQLAHHKQKGNKMDKVTRYEWEGSAVVLVLLCLLGITIPLAAMYFMTHLLRIETQVADGEKLSEFLRARK
jgi:hypothetical protein